MYLKPGHEPSQGQEEAEARRVAAGGLCFVLGAGNQAFLGIVDTLYAMFRDDHTVCLKYHDTQVPPRLSLRSTPARLVPVTLLVRCSCSCGVSGPCGAVILSACCRHHTAPSCHVPAPVLRRHPWGPVAPVQ